MTPLVLRALGALPPTALPAIPSATFLLNGVSINALAAVLTLNGIIMGFAKVTNLTQHVTVAASYVRSLPLTAPPALGTPSSKGTLVWPVPLGNTIQAESARPATTDALTA